MITRPFQMNFTNGEISPLLYDRFDLEKYWNSVEEMENFLILPYGGVRKRPGFHHVCAQGDETRKTRLIPFIFSTEQAYIIEAGHEYFRFFMNHGQIMEGTDPNDVLLLHLDGEDGSQTITDSGATGHTVTAVETAQIDTDQSKFGGSSLYLDGESWVYVEDHADFDFSADNVFTIEMWIRPKPNFLGNLKAGGLFYCGTDDDNYISARYLTDGKIEAWIKNAGIFQQLYWPVTGIIKINTWHHVRVVGDGTNYYLFVDGVKLVEETIEQDMQNFTGGLFIGLGMGGPVLHNGWIDEVKVYDGALSTDDFTPPSSEWQYTGGGAYEIATPYKEVDLPKLQFFQSFDTMYICHPDHAWRKLTRTGHDSWSLAIINHTNGPWLEELSDVAFTPSAITGDITLTAGAAWFLSGHVGSLLRLKIAGAWGYVKITGVDDTTHADATVISALGGTAASTAYQEGAWSDYRGHPVCGCFNEGSLVLVGNNNQPQAVWTSVKGDYENFGAGTDDDDAFIYTIPASNRIVSIGHLQNMVILTSENAAWKMPIEVNKGIYTMSGGSDDYISPSNVRVRASLSSSLLYWQKGNLKLRELAYDPNSFYLENYAYPDLTILAEHITESGIVYSAWQREPYSLLWNNRVDGVLTTMSYMRPENIVGWSRQVTDGEVESVAVIPDPADTYDEVWISVKRTIDGTEHRYIEYYDPGMFVDSGIAFAGVPISTITGLDHLEGETVAIVYEEDGGYLYDEGEVSGGEIALDPALNVLQVGLPITATLKTIKPVISGDGNTTAGLPAKWSEIYISLYQTSGLTINDEEIVFDTEGVTGDPYPTTGFSGNRKVSQLGWGDGNITIVHDAPLPCTILGIYGKLSVG